MTAISPIPELRLLAISSPNDCKRPSGGSGFVICILDTRKRESLIPRRYRFGYAVPGYVFGAIKKSPTTALFSAPAMEFPSFQRDPLTLSTV